MTNLRSSRRVARLRFDGGQVIVNPKDRSVFLMSAEKATGGFRKPVPAENRIEKFESEFLIPLYGWCRQHGSVRACYYRVPVDQVQVLVVTADPKFDFDFATEVAKLELRLAKAGWQVSVSQLPHADTESPETFFGSGLAVEIYAKQGTAPGQGRKQSKVSRKHSA